MVTRAGVPFGDLLRRYRHGKQPVGDEAGTSKEA